MIKADSQPRSGAEGPRIGVYVCRCGGNISDVVDVDAVIAAVKGMAGVITAKIDTFMCSDPGQAMIAEDIRNQALDRIVVASCSPFLHELTFRTAVQRGGLNPYLYEHVNLREQDSWAHPHDPAGATAKAVRLIAAAIGKLRYAEPLERIRISNHRQALVIGGGIAGLKAAAELAGKGIPVLLLEQSEKLGGWVAKLGKTFPREIEGAALVKELVAEVEGNPLVRIFTRARLVAASGFIGNFDVRIALNSLPASGPNGDGTGSASTAGEKQISASVGAIIIATGFEPYAPAKGEYGFGEHAAVVTLPEFVRQMAHPAGELRWNGKPVRNVGFLHCVGSRQIEGVHPPQSDGKVNDYCSRTCCTAILQQALAVKQRFPRVNVFDFHQDIRTYGRGHEDYYTRSSAAGIVFLRFHGDELPVVEAGRNGGPLTVRVKDWLTFGEEVDVPLDLLVLGTGMVPHPIRDLIDLLKLPVGADRFLQEVHPKLRPVEVAVNGVLLAGTAQAPMNIEETLSAASAAASKAAILLTREMVELDPFVAEVNAAECIGCERCFPECAYTGALIAEPGEFNGAPVQKARVNPGLCVGCGACVAVCPTRAIDLKGWTLEQFDAMVDGLVATVPGHELSAEEAN
ncbi:MAG TPA: CoB--CoM heterodisulfide reductase iron-sulfur subunit A family protein [Terracidiphilus sp.]|nr:CoB--CoM heterodisulfide reductase iron-sulfur subunit A family protein [Terracidiphilus sp.]